MYMAQFCRTVFECIHFQFFTTCFPAPPRRTLLLFYIVQCTRVKLGEATVRQGSFRLVSELGRRFSKWVRT